MQGVGIIGAGSFAGNHAKAIAEIAGLKLIAASRRDINELEKFSQRHDIIGYKNYHELLRNDDINAVIIATPHQEHARIAIDAARSGKNILLEKPMATNTVDCERILESVKTAGVTLMIGHTMQFMRSSRTAKKIIESGELGEVIYGTGTVAKKWMNPTRRNWHMNDQEGGGMLMTVGIHYIDLLTWLFNSNVSSVRANLSTRFHDQKADDAGLIFLQYESGATGIVINTGYDCGSETFEATLTCTLGMLKIDMYKGVFLGKNEKWTRIPDSFTDNTEHEALVNEWQAFHTAVETTSEPQVSGEYGKHIMEICFASRESSTQKKEIRL